MLHKTSNSLDPAIKEEVIPLLNKCLADSTNLYLRAKQAHWNVKGEDFIALHKLFDEVSDIALEAEDKIAERIVQLGGQAEGTLEGAIKNTTLPTYPLEITAQEYHLIELVNTLSQISTNLRNDINSLLKLNDQVSANILLDIAQTVDKYLWFVESQNLD